MVAPNGARLSKRDHPALPITIEDTVRTARACFDAGAQALHAHVRDASGAHSLDPGAYRELIAAMAETVPDMPVQITTEAVGMFCADVQRHTVLSVHPEGASVALREMWPTPGPDPDAQTFYAACAERGIAIQHIVYDPGELARLLHLGTTGALPAPLHAIMVLGSYSAQTAAKPSDLEAFLAEMRAAPIALDWAVCAFGAQETRCLVHAHRHAGKMRIGFENNRTNADGHVARDNAERVADLVRAMDAAD